MIDNRHLTVIVILVTDVTIVLEMTSPGDGSSSENLGDLAMNIE